MKKSTLKFTICFIMASSLFLAGCMQKEAETNISEDKLEERILYESSNESSDENASDTISEAEVAQKV